MKNYLITTTTEYGDAFPPVIMKAKTLEDALDKFSDYVRDHLKMYVSEIQKYIQNGHQDADLDMLSREFPIMIESETFIRYTDTNDSGDSFMVWNLYSMDELRTI